MAERATNNASTRPRATIDEPELVSDVNTTPQPPVGNSQSTHESFKTALAALSSNGALNQKPPRLAQTDYYAAVRAEMNAATLNPSEAMNIRPLLGEVAELSGKCSPSFGHKDNEHSTESLQNYHYPHINGSIRPTAAHNTLERPFSEPYSRGCTGLPSMGNSRFCHSNSFSRSDEASAASEIHSSRYYQSGSGGTFPESFVSDYREKSVSIGELSKRHRFLPASQESSMTYDDFYQDETRSLKKAYLPGGPAQLDAANTEDDDRSITTSLFVEVSNKDKSPYSYRVSKRVYGDYGTGERSPEFSHDSYANLPSNRNRHPAHRPSLSPPLTASGGIHRHEDSKYSGVSVPWRTSIVPKMMPGDEISDASLQKRGLKRGQGDKVCKRGYGANDPENIAIVNMKEKDRISFQAIADYLNKQRVAQGRRPTLSVCGIAGRYNRTAPLLFASQGKIFVPLSERRTSEGEARHGTLANPGNDSVSHRSNSSDDGGNTVPGSQTIDERPILNNSTWNGELDVLLVQLHKEYEAKRWQTIAKEFTDRTGMTVDPGQVALRHAIL